MRASAIAAIAVLCVAWAAHARQSPYVYPFQNYVDSFFFVTSILVVSLAWFALSAKEKLPTRWTPVALSEQLSGGTTMWLDKCCVDQTNVEGFLANGIDLRGLIITAVVNLLRLRCNLSTAVLLGDLLAICNRSAVSRRATRPTLKDDGAAHADTR